MKVAEERKKKPSNGISRTCALNFIVDPPPPIGPIGKKKAKRQVWSLMLEGVPSRYRCVANPFLVVGASAVL